jgi:hypothetical protein
MLEAILDGEGQSWEALAASLSDERAFRVLTGGATVAVYRRWPDDPSLRNISDYVAEIGVRYPAELPVAPSVIESVIRGALGEPELLRGTPAKEIALAQLLIIKSIQYDVLTTPADREAWLSDVLDAVS